MAHAFKREYGVSPINYIIDCRIREGKRLLAETDLAPSQIASILGFSSSSYFCKTFSNIEGTSPTEYRKANQVKFWCPLPISETISQTKSRHIIAHFGDFCQMIPSWIAWFKIVLNKSLPHLVCIGCVSSKYFCFCSARKYNSKFPKQIAARAMICPLYSEQWNKALKTI